MDLMMRLRGNASVPPAQMERALKSEEASQAWPAAARHEVLKKLSAARRSLDARTCSSTWSSDCWNSGQSFPPPADTTPMVPCDCDRCRSQGRLWPCIYAGPSAAGNAPDSDGPRQTHNTAPSLSDTAAARPSRLSYECYIESLSDWEAAQIPSSPSGLALRAVREGRVKLRRQRTRLAGRRRAS